MGWEGFKKTLQVIRYLVAGVLGFFRCGEKVYTSDCTVMFGWIIFGRRIGKIVLTYYPVYNIVDLSDSVTNPI